jgi:hypothetical protein
MCRLSTLCHKSTLRDTLFGGVPEPQSTAKRIDFVRHWCVTLAAAHCRFRNVVFKSLDHRKSESVPREADLKQVAGGYVLEAALSDGRVVALLPTDASARLAAGDLKTSGSIAIRRYASDRTVVETVRDR